MQVGNEEYAVFAIKGNTTYFDVPPGFARDEITERVRSKFWLLFQKQV